MKRLQLIILFSIFLIATPPTVIADLEVIAINESALPFSLSPSKFSNSPTKFSNSVSKFSNSPSKFSNSPSKFDNSPSKFDNSESGNRRLLMKKDGSYFYIGYYVWGDDGIINFFSSDGKRLFYSPSETDALFGSEHGEFCGTIARVKDENVLALTEKGQLAFMIEGVSLSRESSIKQRQNAGQYSGGSRGHWIQENIDSGSIMILEDGSIWVIDPLDKIDAMLWLPTSSITIVTSDDDSPGYEYLLINTDDGEKAHAKYLGSK